MSKETEVTDFDKAFGEDMLEEALDELLDRESAVFDLPGIGFAIFESDLRLFHATLVNETDQTAIANGNAIDIRSQILESGLPITNRQAMDNPIHLPNFVWDFLKERRFAQAMLKTGAEKFGERFDRQEEIRARWKPTRPVQTSAWNEIVNMGMIRQVARPGVKDAHQANLPAHEARVLRQLLGGLGGGLKQNMIEQFLVLAGKVA